MSDRFLAESEMIPPTEDPTAQPPEALKIFTNTLKKVLDFYNKTNIINIISNNLERGVQQG